MMSNRGMMQPVPQENSLWVSWHDTQMMASLSPQTVMDYFCRKSNPFYDHICNNETIRMQRLGLEHLKNMVGLEYILLHVAEPILYVIRKQHRHSPGDATPIADYYIIGGMVYKAPDLANVISSRILGTVVNLQAAFEEASSYSRYHPNKGYTWDFSSNKALSEKSKTAKKDTPTTKDESGTVFQMQRVDMLLAELLRKFPPPIPAILHQQINQQQQPQQQQQQQGPQQQVGGGGQESSTAETSTTSGNSSETTGVGSTQTNQLDVKPDNIDMKPPPEKKPKL